MKFNPFSNGRKEVAPVYSLPVSKITPEDQRIDTQIAYIANGIREYPDLESVRTEVEKLNSSMSAEFLDQMAQRVMDRRVQNAENNRTKS